jgi:hypothetical protein
MEVPRYNWGMRELLQRIRAWIIAKKKIVFPAAAAVVLALAAGLFVLTRPAAPAAETDATATPISATPDPLTAEHGAEISDLIETFELGAHTDKMYKDASWHAVWYTGPYLDYIDGYYMSFDDTTLWPIVSQATVTRVKVVEYSADKIRALACVTEVKLDLNSRSKLVAQEPLEVVNGAYVFVKVDGAWKLASFLDMAHPETAKLEYAMMDDELKTLTGDFASLSGLDCPSN